MKPNNANYFAPEIQREYWSVSQFKAFEKCEAAAMAELSGAYKREETPALLLGSYVDAYFSDELEEFIEYHPEIFNSRSGELKADYRKADKIINAIESQPLMLDYLSGEKQRIFTGELFGVKWKIKTDVFDGARIVDLKIVKDLGDIYEQGKGWRSFVEYWGYDLQGAIYTRIEQAESGRSERLPFFLAVGTKEAVSDVQLIEIEEPEQASAIRAHQVEDKIHRFDLIKRGLVPPTRCEKCDYCKSTKILTTPIKFRIEGMENG